MTHAYDSPSVVICCSESSELGTSDISISTTDGEEDFIPTSNQREMPSRSTNTLQRTATLSRPVQNRQNFYLQARPELARETPPSLRWTQTATQSRISCPHCGNGILTNFTPEVRPYGPTLSRSNATVGTITPSTPPTVSSYRGRFKTGWTQSLRKR